MQNASKIVKIIAFVAFVYGGQLFGDDRFEYGFRFDTWSAGRWTDELKKSTPIKNNTKGKLQETKCKSKEDLDEGFTCFDGEIEVSGMLVRNDDDGRIDKPLYFILDKNFHLPAKWVGEPVSASVVLLNADNALLPQPLQKRILGGVGIRAKIKIKDYKYLHKYSYMNNDLYVKATLIEATPFENAEYIHSSYVLHPNEFEGCVGSLECDSCVYVGKWAFYKSGGQNNLLVMHYNSKDSFVNLREKPNGKIITKIYAKDMRCGKEKGRIYIVDEDIESQDQLMEGKNKWVKVFYLPTIEIIINQNQQYIDVSKAIFGYIHSSQLKVSCK
ncbi:hypothetical protein [Helicobacter sp. T3_23-1056]